MVDAHDRAWPMVLKRWATGSGAIQGALECLQAHGARQGDRLRVWVDGQQRIRVAVVPPCTNRRPRRRRRKSPPQPPCWQ